MKITEEELALIKELRRTNHDISNYVLNISLTLDLCEYIPNMAQEDFEELKKQTLVAIDKLHKSQENFRQLTESLTGEGNDPQARLNSALEEATS